MEMNFPTNSLRPTPVDERDFPLGAIVGNALPSDLPDEYSVGEPLIIKDQGEGTDMCTAYALTSVSEDEEEVVLDPFFTFGATKAITGDKEAWGADLRSASKSAVKGDGPYGFLEAKDLSLLTNPSNMEMRNIAADPVNIRSKDEIAARAHAKKSYFVVDGPGDLYDNMRSAMWQTRSEKRSIFTGCNWRSAWTRAERGIIDVAPMGQTFGHAVKVFGWRGEYMKLQLSNGATIGDGGIFWISRLALNQAFTFGAFTFLDMPREEAQKAVEVSQKKISTFFSCIRSPFTRFFNILNLYEPR